MRQIVLDGMYPTLRELYEAWNSLREEERLPSWKEIKTLNLRRWSHNLVLIEVVGGNKYVYRHYGSRFKELFGKDMTGNSLDKLPEAQQALILFEYDYVRTKRGPAWRSYTGDFDGELVTWERLVLPVATNGQDIDMLMVGAYEVRKGR